MVLFLPALMLSSLFISIVGLGQALGFTALLGSGFMGLIFIYGLLTDLVPEDRARCGRDRSAFLFAITMLMQKVGVASAIALAYALLDWGGFDPKNAAASAELIHLVFAVLPSLGWLTVALLLVMLGRVMPPAPPLASATASH
jgi:glycoside/pentoside/hexuronide:cation symporter, GPH family